MLINPRADRSKGSASSATAFTVRVVDRDAEGVPIRGGKMLATGGVFANVSRPPAFSRFAKARSPMRISFAISD